MSTLGLIAGQGLFPQMVVQGMRAAGHRVVVVALRGQADPELAQLADEIRWRSVLRPSSWVRVFRRMGVSEAVMAGRVRKSRLHSRWRWLDAFWEHFPGPDWLSIRLYFGVLRHDRRNEAMLRVLSDALAERGVKLLSSVEYCQEHLAGAGHLAGPIPSEELLADARFAEHAARVVVEADIGQAVVVKERDVIAVEAIEGTDRLIERAGQLCPRGGWTLVKLAKRKQDVRFDVPVVGAGTVENVKRAGGRCIAVEAGKVLLLDKPQTLAAAERCGVTLIGLE